MCDDLIEAFLQYMQYERNCTEATIEDYRQDLLMYVHFLQEETGECDLLHPELDLARAWMVNMSKAGHKASSISRRCSALRSFCRYLYRQGLIKSNPLTVLVMPKTEKPLPVWVPEDQMNYLIDKVDYGEGFIGQRDHLIISLLYHTGIRRSEAAGIKDQDVDLPAMQLRVTGKGRKTRIIPFGEELKVMLSEYKEARQNHIAEKGGVNSGMLLVNDKGEAMSPEGIYEVVHKYLSEIPELSRRGAHVLRHSFATNMLKSGADLMSVKELLGHSSLGTTERYTHLTPKEILENYKQAHPRAK